MVGWMMWWFTIATIEQIHIKQKNACADPFVTSLSTLAEVELLNIHVMKYEKLEVIRIISKYGQQSYTINHQSVQREKHLNTK